MVYSAPTDPALRRMLLPSIIRITAARQQAGPVKPRETKRIPYRRHGLRQLLLEFR